MKAIGELLHGLETMGKHQPLENEYIGEDGAIWCKKCQTPKYREMLLPSGRYAMIPFRCACEEANYNKARDTEREIQRAQAEESRKLLIPVETYRNYRFENDDGKTPELTSIARRYVAAFPRLKESGSGVIFCGGVGTGKTFLAMCIANALIDAGFAVRFTTLAEVVAYARDWDNAARHFTRLMGASAIVLDDLGTERNAALQGEARTNTDFADEQIFRFIDGCYVNKIPLIITTNYMKADLVAASQDTSRLTSARIYHRILERCSTVKVNDTDRRAINGQRRRAETTAVLRG